ncbi:hypothetical protein LSAT2_007547 [Lamellibrachia satsuma]|nr:hypothetical protein LSAT2_007547 [Lamellibrachia satsuma]
MRLDLAVCAGLLTLVWGVNCIHKGDTGWRKFENKKNFDGAFAMCKSFCMKEYFACYQNVRCNKTETKQRIQLCKEQYHECRKKCMEEFDSIDFKIRLSLAFVNPQRIKSGSEHML